MTARPTQVGLALARILSDVQLWETDPHALHTLWLYVNSRVPWATGDPNGLAHPLGNLRQYREFNDAVEDAATVLRLGWQPDDTPPAPDLVLERLPEPVPYPQLEEDTLAHEFTEDDRAQLTMVLGGGEYRP